MKLGFWNRAAIAFTGITTLVFPTWWVMNANATSIETWRSGRAVCLDVAKTMEDIDICQDIWRYPEYTAWGEWPEAAAVALIGCAVLYLLIWLLASIAKWVWKGRAP